MAVLIIDDEPELARLMAGAFRDAGHETDIAPDGLAGLRLFRKRGHDLVVSDMLMPSFDGIETIRAIRLLDASTDTNTMIIAISGGGTIARGAHLNCARKLGADASLAKPFLPSALVALGNGLLAALPSPTA